MFLPKKYYKTILQICLLLIFAYILRPLRERVTNLVVQDAMYLIRHFIHLGLVMGWMYSLHKRIISEKLRNYLVNIALLMFLWLFTRTVRYLYLIPETNMHRWAWYLYYIPIILIPLMGYLSVAQHGSKKHGSELAQKIILYSIATMLILLVLINDMHESVFFFPNGSFGKEGIYRYGWGYLLILAWFFALTVILIIRLVYRTKVPGKGKSHFIPLGILLAGIVFGYLYASNRIDADVTAVICIMIVALVESCIYIGVIPSNIGYEEIFREQFEPAWIVDDKNQIQYASNQALAWMEHHELTDKMIEECVDTPVVLGNDQLQGNQIPGGKILWITDITEMQHLIEQIKEQNERLSEENDLIQAETELKQQRIQITKQSELYERIYLESVQQLQAILELLPSCKEHDQKLMKVCVYAAYVKRMGNLLLLTEENSVLDARELELCFQESLKYVSLLSVDITSNLSFNGKVRIENALQIFETYEEVLESILNQVTELLVRVKAEQGKIWLRMIYSTTEELDVCKDFACGGDSL